MKADRTTLLRMVLCFTLCLAALPASAAPPLPQGPEIRVNTRSQTFEEPSVAVFPDGGFVVAWETGGAGNRVRFFDRQGKPAGPERGLQIRGRVQQIIADRNGSFLALSKGGTASSVTLFLRRFRRDGTPAGRLIRVSTPASFAWQNPIAAVGPDGRLAVAWEMLIYGPDPEEGSRYANAMARVFTSEGAPIGPDITLLAGEPASQAGDDAIYSFPVALAFKPDGTLVALVQDREASGCLQTLLVMIPPDGGQMRRVNLGSVSCGPSRFVEGSLTVGRDGGLIATWSEQDVQAQRLAPDETPREPWFRVAKSWVDYQFDPVSALQAGGSFVIAWTEEVRDGDGKGIFGRAFAANGAPRSGDFQINVTTEGDQHNPVIAAARQGPVVVVWMQPTAQGGSDIFARVLSETR
ncbi:MAG TPA: hypothetical protein VJ885_15400 [Thermoanaerobaculia bacterium]|nr:hypothetical protein [Thermoanaerobaculia bacterium]